MKTGHTGGAGKLRNGSGAKGGAAAEPLVVTVTANVAGAPLVRDRLEGTWQVALRGAPLQESEIAPLKPVPGVS